jgi:hypothetical protein
MRNLLLIPEPGEAFHNTDTVLQYAQARTRVIEKAPADLLSRDIELMVSFEDQGITFTGTIKLADFGSGFLSVDGSTGRTRWDMKAPERLECDLERWEGNAWGLPANIWALGCTILELITGNVFFQGPGKIPWRMWTDKTFVRVVGRKLGNLEHELRAFLRVHARSDMTNAERTVDEKMIKGMLRGTAEDRLTIDGSKLLGKSWCKLEALWSCCMVHELFNRFGLVWSSMQEIVAGQRQLS